jgi:hypothetical protein
MVSAGFRNVVLIGGVSGQLGSNLNLRLSFPEDVWVYRDWTQAWTLAYKAAYGPAELLNSNQTQMNARLLRRAFHSCTPLHSSINLVRCFGGAAPKVGEEPQSPGTRTYLLSDLIETSDFFEFDVRDGTLARITRKQLPWPTARVDASMTSFGQYTVVVGGGMLTGTRAPLPDMDMWLYSDVAQTWRTVEAVGNVPTGRFSPVIMFIDDGLDPTDPRQRLLLVGGCEYDDVYSCMPCTTATAAVDQADRSRIYSTNPSCINLRRNEASEQDVPATGTANASDINPPGQLPINRKQGHLLLLNNSMLHVNGSGDPPAPAKGEWRILEAAENLLIPDRSLLSRQPCAAPFHEATLRCLGPAGGGQIMVTLQYIPESAPGSPSDYGTLQQGVENPDKISESLAIYGGGNLAELSRGYFLHFGGFAGLNFLGSTDLYSTGGRFWSQPGAVTTQGSELLRPAVAVAGDTAFVFGGISAENEVSGDLWRVDLRFSTWTRVAGVDAPGTRYGASLTPLPSRDMLCYGGIGNGWLGDGRPVQSGIYILKSSAVGDGLSSAQGQSIWRAVQPDVNTRTPPPRSGHSAVSLSQDGDEHYRVFVFGGWEEVQVTDLATAKVRDDLWIFSVEANRPAEEGRWLKPTVDKQYPLIFPTGRAEHVGGGIWLDNSERVMVISGGLVFSGDASSPVAESAGDVWLLRFNVNADGNITVYWTAPDVRVVRGDLPYLFFSATATLNKRDLYAYGGLMKQEGAWVHSSAVYLGRASSDGAVWTWQQLQLSPASSRFGSALAALPGPHGPLLLSAGGAQLQGSGMTTKLPTLRAELACPPGTYRVNLFFNCLPCPHGTFSTTPGSSACTACPGDGYTTDDGGSAVANCTVCRPGACSSRGLCTLNRATNVASCQCRTGYAGKDCSRNVGMTTGLSLLGLILALVLAFFLVRRYRRRVSSLKGYNALQDKLIEESRLELDELKRVWEVDVADVDFLRRVDGGSEGAFGEVWLASWQGRRVAIKQLRLSVQEIDGKAEADFDAEVAFLRSLRHRNIVFFYGTGVRGASPFLVTEFMERGSLHSVLVVESGTLAWDRRLQFARDVAAGMAFLHTLSPPRMHRDLKGANVLVSQDYVCKIADFGTVKLLAHISGVECGGASTTVVSQGRGFRRVFRRRVEAAGTGDDDVEGAGDAQPGLAEPVGGSGGFHDSMAARAMTTAVGTFLWTAPEMLRDEPYALPADVYSFGMVLYEVASGRVPFDDDHRPLWTLRTAITDEDYRPIMPTGAPAAFVALAHACWAPRPEMRPSFAAAHAQLLAM